jgi:ribosomal protein S18 acetylase RimI-like enzyme|tara:strand:- start:27 stop:533 length:507 start_codon:yes stop_codon:yes gene_type:complete
VIEYIDRNYLEIKSLEALVESKIPNIDFSINIQKSEDFQINKFLYKNIGKKHNWTDRLVWSDQDWIKYFSDPKVETYILKINEDLAGYFESIVHFDTKEIEIAYFGLLEEYHNKKLGGYLLSYAIKNSFKKKEIKRVWVHTCSLDHKNALKNYLSRGMKIYKKETIKI